jgi:hypothetical protein
MARYPPPALASSRSPAATVISSWAVFIIVIAGAKLRSEVVSADSMLMFTVWRPSSVDDAQLARVSHGPKRPTGTRIAQSLFILLLFHHQAAAWSGMLHAPCNAFRRSAALLSVHRD